MHPKANPNAARPWNVAVGLEIHWGSREHPLCSIILLLCICCILSWDWASLLAQMVTHLPAMQETWVRSLGWEDALEEGHGNPLQYSCP